MQPKNELSMSLIESVDLQTNYVAKYRVFFLVLILIQSHVWFLEILMNP
jgi:hypothetical protein